MRDTRDKMTGKPSTENSMPARERVNPYERFHNTDLILRDQLAIDRTILANERTFLAYARTGLALILTGSGFMKFFEGPGPQVIGFVLIIGGIAVAGIGIQRSLAMARNIATAGKGLQHEQDGIVAPAQ